MKNLLCRGLLLLSAFNGISAFAAPEQERKAEIQRYIDVFKNSPSVQLQKDVCNELQWAGISDVRVYDLIAEKLKTILPVTPGNKANIDTAAWYAKGLASSGMEKYNKILEEMAASPNKKLKKYANEALGNVEKYKKWNPIISNSKNFRNDQTLQVNRFANMLKSNDFELKLIAAKRIHHDHVYNEYMLDILRDQLMASYKAASDGDALRVEVYKWMVKSLSGSRNRKYYENLKEVELNTANKKLRVYTSKTIRGYYGE